MALMLLTGCRSSSTTTDAPDIETTVEDTVKVIAEDTVLSISTATLIPTAPPTPTQVLPTRTPMPTSTSKATRSQCTLTGGEIVQEGWSGKDTGHNFCNQCMCLNAGLACTKMACPALNQQKYDNSAMPKLHNLGIMNLGPYNDANRTFGDLLFDTDLTLPIFIEFGATIDRGQSNTFNNPNFEFRGPADTIVISPIDGVVTQSDWQPSAGYVQDDWEVIISPSMRSSWGVSIDHVVSIDCDRKGSIPAYCDKPLQIDGVNLEIGTEVEIGDVIGYMGNWMENGTRINGRTEITLFQYIENYDSRSIDSVSYCPTLNIAEPVESSLKDAVVDLMGKYEMVHAQDSVYDESQMVAPGCIYSMIEENEAGGKSMK